MQVASRILITELVVRKAQTHTNAAYPLMIFSWGLADLTRYLFYTLSLIMGTNVPGWIRWLRYSAFFVLYLTGAASEWLLMNQARKTFSDNVYLKWFLTAMQVIWIPGLYVMYTHMIKQRAKALSNNINTSGRTRKTNSTK